MSGNDSTPRRSGALRATILIVLGLALLGGAGWRLLRVPARHPADIVQPTPAAVAAGTSGAETAVVVQAPEPSAPAQPLPVTAKLDPQPEVAQPQPAAPPVAAVSRPAAPATPQPGPRPAAEAAAPQAPAVIAAPTPAGSAEPAAANAEAAPPPPVKPAAPRQESPTPQTAQTQTAQTQTVATQTAPTPAAPVRIVPAETATTQATAAPTAPDQTATGPEAPSFDVVRISPQGSAVVAGRAAPNADVTLLDNGRAIGHTQADRSGQWVVLPDKPLPAGGQELTLAAREAGKAEVAGDAPVVLVVPEQAPAKRPGAAPTIVASAEPQTPAAPLAVLTPSDAAPRLLQAAPAVSGRISGKVGLDVVDYDDRGAIRFAGTGAPGSLVRLYVDDVAVGDAIVDPQGRWGLLPTAAVAAGDHRLRLDDLGIHGQVTARVELPFQRALLSPNEVLDGRVVVQPRQNLWRIARRAYGHGTRYTVIYEANRSQIRDPNRIYPGQIFAVPAALDAAAPTDSTATSASPSKSR